jgi:hypothetical protein
MTKTWVSEELRLTWGDTGPAALLAQATFRHLRPGFIGHLPWWGVWEQSQLGWLRVPGRKRWLVPIYAHLAFRDLFADLCHEGRLDGLRDPSWLQAGKRLLFGIDAGKTHSWLPFVLGEPS